MNHDEHAIQVAIADYLRVALNPGTIFFAVPNGGHFASKIDARGKRVSLAAARLLREGMTPGVADTIVIDARPDGFSNVIALETKTHQGTLSRVQKDWRLQVQAAGAAYYVVRSIEDVAAALQAEGVALRALPSTAPGRLYQPV